MSPQELAKKIEYAAEVIANEVRCEAWRTGRSLKTLKELDIYAAELCEPFPFLCKIYDADPYTFKPWKRMLRKVLKKVEAERF